ncbi:MAG: sigma 54-interacting transcriptional regulator [Planctomycetota bacterium]
MRPLVHGVGLARVPSFAYHLDVMSNPDTPLLNVLREALCSGDQKVSRLSALPSMLGWLQEKSASQRAFLITAREDGSYRIWCSQDTDGRKIKKAANAISHHAFQQACESEEPTLFSDAHLDRRFKTPAEAQGGTRSQWILVIPINVRGEATALYLDSKFDSSDSNVIDDQDVKLVCSVVEMIVDLELSREALPVAESETPASLEAPVKSIPAPEAVSRSIESHFGEFTSYSPILADTIAELRKIALTRLPVLIEGESGTGKELLARALHEESGREGPMVVLHCGSITESLIEIELFGNEKGAFTDADVERAGLIETATGGSLLIDAVHEASPALQASLLRFLESGVYRRVAGEEERVADVRIIACSAAIDGNPGFRDDLYYRIAGFRAWLPPLRERPEDALMIVEKRMLQETEHPPKLLSDAQALLLSHPWRGNGWEAVHLARRMLAAGHQQIDGTLMLELLGNQSSEQVSVDPGVREVLGLAEREVILRALEDAGGNKTIACKALGISRRTLYRRMRKHGIPLKGSTREES